MNDDHDQVVYRNGRTMVTRHAVRHGVHTVPLTQIQRLSLLRRPPDYTLAAALVTLGIVLMLIGHAFEHASFLAPTLAGLAMVMAGLERLGGKGHGVYLHLVAKTGTEHTLPLSDRAAADEVVQAIDRARIAALTRRDADDAAGPLATHEPETHEVAVRELM